MLPGAPFNCHFWLLMVLTFVAKKYSDTPLFLKFEAIFERGVMYRRTSFDLATLEDREKSGHFAGA